MSTRRTNGDKRYLWAFVAARYVVYTVAVTRGSEVLVGLLGAVFQGILCNDRFSAYLKYNLHFDTYDPTKDVVGAIGHLFGDVFAGHFGTPCLDPAWQQ